jgi:16S rRNA (adenine1518-N6/adenine1519-N6)-dimethyltransferase
VYTLKKSLGQHFLQDENICRKIVSVLQERPVTQLLEVGPGGGALTKHLIEWSGIDFKAVEIDDEKVEYLLKAYPSLAGKIIHKSFLEIEAPFSGSFTVVGNFPYNISTQILFHVLQWRDQVECVVGMFQKEVAERVAAPSGNKVYGVISVLIQTFFEVEYLFEVHERYFNPPPKVKSGVIRLVPRTELPVFASEKKLFLLVKTAFNQRRKMLRNAVRGLFDPETLADPIFDLRAEALTVEQFSALTFRMQ